MIHLLIVAFLPPTRVGLTPPVLAQDVREEELQIQVLGKIGGVAQRSGRFGGHPSSQAIRLSGATIDTSWFKLNCSQTWNMNYKLVSHLFLVPGCACNLFYLDPLGKNDKSDNSQHDPWAKRWISWRVSSRKIMPAGWWWLFLFASNSSSCGVNLFLNGRVSN